MTRCSKISCMAWLSLTAPTFTAAPVQAQVVSIDAPAALHAAAARVRGLDWDALDYDLARAGLVIPPAIHVTLVAEDTPRAREVPRWVVGRAFGATHLELFPARTGRYPYASLEAVLRHEVAHLALASAAADKPLPRWFHEGVATSVEGGWSGADQVRLALAALTSPRLGDVRTLFASDAAPDSALAYLLAATVVDDLRMRQGRDVPGAIARRVSEGVPFDQAFEEMTGATPDEAAGRAWRAFRWYTPLLASAASGTAVWLLMLGLAGIAFVVRRTHRARQRARWDAEDLAVRLQHGVEDEHAGQSDDGDDRFHDRPRLQGLGDREVEVLLEDPEASVVDVRQRKAAGADAQDEQVGVDALPRDERPDEAGGGERRDGRRADTDADDDGHAPGQHEGRRRERFER